MVGDTAGDGDIGGGLIEDGIMGGMVTAMIMASIEAIEMEIIMDIVLASIMKPKRSIITAAGIIVGDIAAKLRARCF